MRSIQRMCLLASLVVLALAAAAQADTVTLRCAGKGARNRDSANTTLCASSPKGRTLAGTVRDDAGRPVAARLTVTYSSWTPTGDSSFTIRARATQEITAKGDGTFAIRSNPATKESIKVTAVADATLGVSGAGFAQADVSRQLVVRVAKLGGGVVRVSVSGTTHRPLKVYVLDESGYPLPGVKARNADARGRATFNLGSRRGRFTTYVDAGDLGDLFWDQSRLPFKL